MPQSAFDRAERLARAARRWVLVYAVGMLLLVSSGMLLVVAGGDFLLRIEDTGIRWISSGGMLAAVAFSIFYFLLPAWRYRPSVLQAARRIERLHPDLGDRLSSALAFASQEEQDVSAGSATLRRAAIAEAEAAIDGLDWSKAIDRRPSLRAAGAAGALSAVIVILLLLDSSSTLLAVKRLAMPWAAPAWPRWNSLEFLQAPTRLASGQPLEIEVKDRRGRLPETVELEFQQIEEGVEPLTRKAMKRLAGRMVYRQEDLRRSVAYRALGGDDVTEWIELEVVEPPTITEIAAVIVPPAHTGWPLQNGFGLQSDWKGYRV